MCVYGVVCVYTVLLSLKRWPPPTCMGVRVQRVRVQRVKVRVRVQRVSERVE